MEHWDINALSLDAHQPQVLRSDDETRAIVLLLPAGEELQEHQVHERAYVVVVGGRGRDRLGRRGDRGRAVRA